jgi:hypothetical protein
MFAKNKCAYMLIILGLLLVSQAEAQYDRAESGTDFPLPVLMVSFAAVGGPNCVVLDWKTASETEISGFNVYRSMGLNGTYARINLALVPAQGSGPQGHEYQYQDGNLVDGFHYYYKLATVDVVGREIFQGMPILGIAGNYQGSSWAQPPDFSQLTFLRLKGNYPEPFNGRTSIVFSVYEAGQVKMEVFNLTGSRVATLVDGYLQPGEYERAFGDNALASGIYLYRLQGEHGYDSVRKMVLLR